jgi:hypothetical protein
VACSLVCKVEQGASRATGIGALDRIRARADSCTSTHPHDLLARTLQELAAGLSRAVISELCDDTECALLSTERNARVQGVDASPIDAIAVRTKHRFMHAAHRWIRSKTRYRANQLRCVDPYVARTLGAESARILQVECAFVHVTQRICSCAARALTHWIRVDVEHGTLHDPVRIGEETWMNGRELAIEFTDLWKDLGVTEINGMLARNVSYELLEFFSSYAQQFAEETIEPPQITETLLNKLPNLLIIGYMIRILEERIR